MFRFEQSAGPHTVGLTVLNLPGAANTARSLQTLIWYPASPRGGARMTVDDYLGLFDEERAAPVPEVAVRTRDWRAGMSASLRTRLWAVRDAPRTSGQFPLVIYAPGYSNPAWENADLCEYLASHGYLVLASPSMGVETPYPTLDLQGAHQQARDILFLVDLAQTLPDAQISALAVAGFSWGGLCNVIAAARDARIRGLVALDGGLLFHPGLLREGTETLARRMTIPLLSIAQAQSSEQSDEALDAWVHGDLVNVKFAGFTHAEHVAMAQRNEAIWQRLYELYPAKKMQHGREKAVVSYGWLARYTLEFLNAYLKHNAAGQAFLRRMPEENGAPAGLMAAHFRAARATDCG